MYAGAIVETGSIADVIDNPLHPYTKGLLASVPDPDPKNRTRLRPVIPGEPPVGGTIPEGCPFHPRCPQFQRGRCDAARPPLELPRQQVDQPGTGHMVACVLYQ